MSKYKPYPKYKDSGVEWLGQVPEGWEHTRIRSLLKPGYEGMKIGPFGSALKLEDMVDKGIKIYGQENIINNNFTLGKREISFDKYTEMATYTIAPKDLLITLMGTSGRCQIVPKGVRRGIIDSHLLRVRPENNKALSVFLRWLIDEAPEIAYQVKIMGKGSIMHGLNSSIIKELWVPLPSVEHQTKIAAFLDHETAKIDRLIAKQQQLIALLKEKRQAVISHAVTKGLDPSAPMKDSGVEWLGEIPAHWEVKRLKHVAQFAGGATPSKDNLNYWGGNIPWVSPKDMKTKNISRSIDTITSEGLVSSSTRLIPPGSTLIVVRSGILRHKIPTATNSVPVALNQDMKAVLFSDQQRSLFYMYLTEGHESALLLRLRKQGATVESIEHEYLSNEYLPIPPSNEMNTILEYIKGVSHKYNSLSKKTSKAITLLQERRTALISAAVTGKIDVRDWQPNNNGGET